MLQLECLFAESTGTQKSATACYDNGGQVCTCEVFEVDAGGGQGSFAKWHQVFGSIAWLCYIAIVKQLVEANVSSTQHKQLQKE